MKSTKISKSDRKPGLEIVGVWWLISREDFTTDGTRRIDPLLGEDPLGILTYTANRFAAQFMKRDRSINTSIITSVPGQNNTVSIGGYDAYFGRYEINKISGEVIHHLEGALTAENVGIEVSRKLHVDNDRLEIQLDTTTVEGEPVTRTLTWKRIG